MKKLFSVRRIILAGSLLLQLNTLCFHSRGAAGDVAPSFDPGSGVNGWVNAIAVQADGKAIIGGQFNTVKGLARINVARLNADGSGDSSFNETGVLGGAVSSIALQSDDTVLVGSDGIFRLNSNGSRDTNLNAIIGTVYFDEEGNSHFSPDGHRHQPLAFEFLVIRRASCRHERRPNLRGRSRNHRIDLFSAQVAIDRKSFLRGFDCPIRMTL